MMLILACEALTWTMLGLPETLPKARREPLHSQVLWFNDSRVHHTPQFLLFSAIPTLNIAAILFTLHLRQLS